MTDFWKCLRAEIIKSRGSFAVWLSLAGTIANTLIFFGLHLFEQVQLPIAPPGAWSAYIANHYISIAFMMLPLYVIILTNLVAYMEHRQEMWVQLYTLPVSRWNIYFSKQIFVLLLFIAAHVLFIIGTLLTGLLFGLIRPDSGLLQSAPDFALIAELSARTVLSILGLLALQFWVSMRFRHFIIPLTIGILGFVTVSILSPQWTHIYWIPYAHPIIYMPEYLGDVAYPHWGWLSVGELLSVLYFVVFTVIGYWDVRRQNVN